MMDFWASLEHQLRYMQNKDISSRIDIELKACAEVSATLDRRMQKIFDDLNKMDWMEDVFYMVKQDFPLIKSDLEKILESEM